MKKLQEYSEEQIKLITPRQGVVNIIGAMTYSEGNQAWSVMRLRKELLHEFPQLKEKRENFVYKMIVSRGWDGVKEEIKKLEKSGGGVVPILLFFGKGET